MSQMLRVALAGAVLAAPALGRPLGAQAVTGQHASAPPAYAARLGQIVPGLLARYRVPGAVVAVVEPGRAPWVGGFGSLAERAESRLEVASLTKPVFACAVLRLVQEGRLALDTPLVRYLPRAEWDSLVGPALAADPRGRQITARMVLSHTTGLPNWRRGAPLTLAWAPGERWGYSGEGYQLLQRVVERITGGPLEGYLRRAVFAPLGMTRTTIVDSPGAAARSLRTTAGDYARFLAAILSPAEQPAATLDADALRTARVPKVWVDSELGLAWGLGWALALPPAAAASPGQLAAPADVIFHWGSNPGFKSFALVDFAAQRALVMLTNGDAGLELAEPVTAAVLPAAPGARPWFRFYMLHPND